MSETGTGSGDALDATTVIDETPDPDDEARIQQGHEQAAGVHRVDAERAVHAAELAVEQAQADLAGAQDALATAQADLNNLNGA